MANVSEEYLLKIFHEIVGFNADFNCEWPGCKAEGPDLNAHHFDSRGNLSIKFDPFCGLYLCTNHHTGRISAHSEPKIFEAMIIYYQVRTIEWLQEVIERKNKIITVAPEIYREEQKEVLLAEMKRLGIRGWRK
jgi:Zn-finger protein